MDNQDKIGSSPEMISSSYLTDIHQKQNENNIRSNENNQPENPSIYQSGHFQPVQINFEQHDLFEEIKN